MLACSAISLTGQFSANNINEGIAGAKASLLPEVLPLILPFAVLVVPFVDLVLAVVRRTRAGRSPFSPDKKHLHHRLLEIGHSQRRAVLVMYLWTGSGGVRGGRREPVLRLVVGDRDLGDGRLRLLLTFGLPGHAGIITPEQPRN